MWQLFAVILDYVPWGSWPRGDVDGNGGFDMARKCDAPHFWSLESIV